MKSNSNTPKPNPVWKEPAKKQESITNVTTGFKEKITHNITPKNYNVVSTRVQYADTGDTTGINDTIKLYLKTKPAGVSRRKFNWNRGGIYWYNCECGKSSGDKGSVKARDLWVRLHKKNCVSHNKNVGSK